MLAEPLTGVLLAAFLLGQPLGLPELIGGAGVLIGAILAQRPAAATAGRPTATA
jgi:drug/metabolite transporter (DMT)-like permease